MDAYLDDFKTSILLGCERGSGEASRDYRGPIDYFLKRSPISLDFHEISFATTVEKKDHVNMLAPRARICSAGVDSDSNLPKHVVPV